MRLQNNVLLRGIYNFCGPACCGLVFLKHQVSDIYIAHSHSGQQYALRIINKVNNMQAIHVKVLAPTASKCLRFKAVGLGMCAVTSNSYDLNGEANAAAAAQELLDNYNMQNQSKQFKIRGIGTLPDNTWAVLIQAK